MSTHKEKEEKFEIWYARVLHYMFWVWPNLVALR